MKFPDSLRPAVYRAVLGCYLLAAGVGLLPGAAAAAREDFDVRQYAAVGDGQTLDTAAIQRAVDACGAAGGGRVMFPAGTYLTGTIHLRSNVEWHLLPDARILGSTNLSHYDQFAAGTDLPRDNWHRGLLIGEGITNVAFTGPGVLDGNRVFDPHGEERLRGPHLLLLGHCANVTLREVTLQDAANYAFLYLHTDNVSVDYVTFLGGWDGLHFRASAEHWNRGLRITHCQFFTGDDCIAGHYQQDALIEDCTINSSCNGIRVIGPVQNFVVAQSDFSGPGRREHRTSHRTNMLAAICLQPGAWTPTPGRMDEVYLHDLTLKDVTTPFHIALRAGNSAGTIRIQNVTATGAYRAPITVESWGEPTFDAVSLQHVQVEFTGGGTAADAGLEVRPPGVDARKLPAWGLYLRGVKRLTLDHVTLTTRTPDARPAMKAEGGGELVETAVVFQAAK